MNIRLLTLLSCLWLLVPAMLVAAEAPKLVYTAATYDPKADPDADLAKGKVIAARENRRILIIAGGDWCPWCRAMGKFIESNPTVAAILARSYVVQKVTVSDEVSNTGFLNPLGPIEAYPHLFILDRDGRLLHSQDTGKLERNGSYDEAAFAALLRQWAPRS